MTAEAQTEGSPQPRPGSRIALRLSLGSGPCSIPLQRVHSLVGFAALTGEPEEYFLGWLTFHGELVPVFDLNSVVCDEPTLERFGSRIVIVDATADAPTRHIGLLAAGMTDTISPGDAGAGEVAPLALDSYLPMLATLIPAVPR